MCFRYVFYRDVRSKYRWPRCGPIPYRRYLIPLSAPSGLLRIGAMESTASTHLPLIFARYHERFPEVELSMRMTPTADQIEDIFTYKADGAFVDGPVLHPEIVE
ncbi:LysR substrate-binding domain-containing protein [Saccharibacillus sacchari]|uniref:LysR substrate-binding domain-containing protein n=1 Tax=Saccharibacillus sacchari TaxID=456493 RepID=UPI00247FAA6B|nr:LysR substrate-binding domain-containing protein [Saccharibacillus sacchari]